jgi:hypothetical protein
MGTNKPKKNSNTINTDVDILGWAQITKTCICSFRGQTTR